MTIIHKSRIVPYSTEQMFQLVDKVEDYAAFIPYCSESIVHHRDTDEVQATLVIQVAGMQKSFTTRNRLQHNKMIELRLVKGPFNHLEGFWRFDETPEGCMITFDLEFEFASKVVGMMLNPVFEQVTCKMVDAFCDRAVALYGESSSE